MTEWREALLGEALQVRHGFAFKSEHFREDGDLIVLTPGNFMDSGGFKLKSGKEKYYHGPVPPTYLLSRGDVVVAMTEQAPGLLGSSATIPSTGRFLHNQRLGLLQITNPEVLDLRFTYHLMNSSTARRQIEATATGSKVRHTAPDRIRAITVLLPDIYTQRKIGAVLDTVDALIENNRRRAEVLEEMARAVYREWFVRFRYPGHEEVALVDSPSGLIPEGWTVTTLDSIATVNARSRPIVSGEVVRYLDISAIGDRTLSSLTALDACDAPGRARRVVAAGDVVWSMVRPNRRAHALLIDPGPDWIASTGIAVLSATKVSSTWLFETTSAQEFSDYLVSQEGGAAYPAVKPKDFGRARLVIPPAATDRAFADRVAPLHHLIWILRKQSEALVRTRDLLLPNLVTGRVDVSHLALDDLTEGALT